MNQSQEQQWVSLETKPPFDTDILISYDGGETIAEECFYMKKRQCMLAGISGGNGYFGEGFATNGSTGCEKGLILDPPTHWKLSTPKTHSTK